MTAVASGRKVGVVTSTPVKVSVENQLPLPIDVFERDAATGRSAYLGLVKPTQTLTFAAGAPSIRVMLTGSGAIVLDRDLGLAPFQVVVDPLVLTAPNRIPAPVPPSATLPIPPDSVPLVVGVGRHGAASDGVVIVREQYWHKGPESFSLPPRSSLQKIVRQTAGRTASSSTTAEVTKELNLMAGAGWGPFSATASASLSTTSQRTDTITIREESSSAVVQTFINDADNAVVVCLWQLVDRIRVFKRGTGVVSIDNGQLPLIPLSYEVA